ncbi:hypothetical protein NPIL_632671 [Nephila pilipes]|uniref:Uncharacterized protein n=1 Tax=Nephila pilipes TaxID=299642 RepID=A0A8X6PCF6_NEPPI|nr:hypothetical protein NPIL_632671 [Nephila pilipes]
MVLDVRLDLIRKVKKRDFCPIELHVIALETIHIRIAPNEWLHIYTDGSFLDFSQGAGTGNNLPKDYCFSDSFLFYLHVEHLLLTSMDNSKLSM